MMMLANQQPYSELTSALMGISFFAMLFGVIWAFAYTEKMWLRHGIDTTFEGFVNDHHSTFVRLRGLIAMLVAYVSVIGPLALIPTLCVELFGKEAFGIGSTLGLVWFGFVVTIGKAWLFPTVRKVFFIPPRDLTPYTSKRDYGPIAPDK